MEYKILYFYDFWNDVEETYFYNQLYKTQWSFEELKIGTRLYIHNDNIAVVKEIRDITDDIKMIITARSVTIIKILNED